MNIDSDWAGYPGVVTGILGYCRNSGFPNWMIILIASSKFQIIRSVPSDVANGLYGFQARNREVLKADLSWLFAKFCWLPSTEIPETENVSMGLWDGFMFLDEMGPGDVGRLEFVGLTLFFELVVVGLTGI